ncbi:signal transduction histidine kinase [Kineosphaera limosa]|uniref:Putative histidine kinase n=1 Tax=Kineosphaera limosa NBRC 100340 TaxID=1184609 RepID=K6X1K8_9MICO|nr:ATP-binding protein [Kineosphaera limosa]NYE01587.1 signal transduction histidine kinase [Kineosphaera limosa]GAB98247.1 putative histidine kinase [Kineosphaera limosa NBRC 100340]
MTHTRSAPRAWQTLLPRPSTTRVGLDLVFVYVIVALRIVNMAQLVPAVLGTVGRSPQPALDLMVATGFLAWSVVLITLAVRDGSLLARGWLVRVDVVVACACLLATLVTTAPELRVSTWDAWGGSVAASTALFAGIAMRTTGGRVGAAAALWLCAVIPATLVPGHPQVVLAGWTNSLIYPAYTAIGFVAADYLRRVADAADEARRVATEAAGRAAAEAEAARHRALLHDQATILDLVSRRIEDPLLAEALRRQAGVEARKLAAFMTQPPLASPEVDERDLAGIVRSITAEFADLSPVVSVDLAQGTMLPEPVAATLSSALTTLLHNVRRHAHAEHCVVHADADEHGWELVVRDDGVGFDPATSLSGYGLPELVLRAGAAHGLAVTIDSAPGQGTAVTVRSGPLLEPEPEKGSAPGRRHDDPGITPDRQTG